MKTFFLLLFGIVLVGLSLFFITYKNNTEGFQASSSIPIVESDKFLNDTLDPLTPTFTGFSTLYGIKEDFKAYVTDWHNFSGNKDRTYGNNSVASVIYNDYNDNIIQENIPANDIPIHVTLTNGAPVAALTTDYDFLYFYRGQTWVNRDVVGENSESIPTVQYGNYYVCGYNSQTTCKPLDYNTFYENFNKYINTIQKNKPNILRQFQQGLQLWNTSIFENKITPSIYLACNYYNATQNTGVANWWASDIQVHGVHGRSAPVSYNIGQFRGNNYTPPNTLINAQSEQLKLYVYGSFCNYHSNDFRECLHWGTALDFKDVTLLDMYINIPYYDKYMNGSNIYYSYGLFFPEVKPKSASESFVYIPNELCISNNTFMRSLRNDSGNAILKPNTFATTIGYDNDGYINSIKYGTNLDISQVPTVPVGINIASLQQLFTGKITPQILAKMPNMMHRFITSWAYNRTLRTIDSLIDSTHNNKIQGNDARWYNIDKASYLLGLAYNNWSAISDVQIKASWLNYLTKYMYSNIDISSKNTIQYLPNNNISEVFNNNNNTNNFPNPEICALAKAIMLKYSGAPRNNSKPTGIEIDSTNGNYWIKSPFSTDGTANTNSPTGRIYYKITSTSLNPNLSYKTSGDTWDLDNDTIQSMVSDFKNNVQKLIPDYGIASNIKVLDQKMLDSIAQSFYEYSDGLFEINMIYDVYIVGSNMMDIRFDKKQRLGPASYITLRNQYQPKIIEYNNLVSMYDQNSWQDTYSNVNDLLSNISTIKTRDLEPVFNPVYTIGNRNPNDIRADINRLNASNIVLTSQLSLASAPITNVTSAPNIMENTSNTSNHTINSNVANYFTNLLNTPNNPVINIGLIQSKIDSNNTALNNLSNQLDGIETNVARLFFTMTSSSNLAVNGVALGPNAALTYNPIYNAALQADMGQSQGNVNYQPTIIYTKNVTPIIDPTNIEFMKQAAQLYMDAIPLSLSSFTKSMYPADENNVLSNGIVRVDKIFGSSKLDDKTVGFTWQESQYNYLTNKPVNQRVVDVILKFAFDNTEYQNPQIYIDNRVSNIYILSNNLSSNTSNYYLQNITTISNYQSNIRILSNQIRPLTDENAEILIQIGNIGSNNLNTILALQNSNNIINSQILTYMSNYIYSSSNYIYGASGGYYYYENNGDPYAPLVITDNSINSNISLFFSQKYSNLTHNTFNSFYNIIINLPDGPTNMNSHPNTVYVYDANGIRKIATTFDRTFRPYSIYKLKSKIINTPLDSNIINLSNVYADNIATINRLSNEIIDVTNKLNKQYNTNSNIIAVKTQQISDYNNLIYEENSINSNFNIVNGRFKFTKFTNAQGNIFLSNDFIKYKDTIENLPSNLATINYSNLAVKILYTPNDEDNLDNNDGACPANMTCGNPVIMSQLMEAYNLDSNNNDKILRFYKAFTPNPFQCDYSVEMVDSNGRTKKGTIAFEVGQDIADCTYYITSNHGFNTGYYIIDKVDYVQDSSGTDISGFSYVGNALYGFSNSVKNVFNPLINSASNSVSSMINTLAISRLNTYEALGKINVLTVNNCPTINYDTLTQLLMKVDFIDSIFKSYPYFKNHISKILRAGISGSNTIDITYETIEITFNPITLGTSERNHNLEGARFMISTTQQLCDFYPVFMCNISPFPSRNTLNLSNNTTYAYTNTISHDINIGNPFDYSYKVLDAQSIELSNIIAKDVNNYRLSNIPAELDYWGYEVQPSYTQFSGKIIKTINSYKRIDIDKFIFNITSWYSTQPVNYRDIGFEDTRETNENILYEIGRNSIALFNQQYIRSKTILTNTDLAVYINKYGAMISYNNIISSSNCRIGDSNSPIYTSNNTYYFTNNALTELRNKIGIRNIYDYRIKPSSSLQLSNSFEAELIIYNNVSNLPINRTNIYVSGYYNNSKLYILNALPLIFPTIQTSFIFEPVYVYDMALINTFRNYFNSTYYNGSNYPEISKIYNGKLNTDKTVTYGVSVYYKTSSNTYNFSALPNDTRYVSLRYFNVQFYNRLTEFGVLNVNEVTAPSNLSNINDTNPIIQSNYNYFMSNLRFKSFKLEGYSNSNNSYQLIQIELYHDSIYKYTNINNTYSQSTYVPPSDDDINFYGYIYDDVTNTYIDTTNNETVGTWDTLNYNYLTNNANVNHDNEDEVQVYEFDRNNNIINIDLNSNINISGYSIASGDSESKCLTSWKLHGSIDGSNFFILNSVSNYSDSNNYPSAYYRTPIFSVYDNTSNIPLIQYPFHQKSIAQCGIDPLNSNIINYLYNIFPLEIFPTGYSAEEGVIFDIKNIISYKVNTNKINFLVNVFKVEDPPSIHPRYYTDIIELTLRIADNCSYTINYTKNINNFSFTDSYIYSNLPSQINYLPISNYNYISNIAYNHTIRGTYLGCDPNFKSDSYEPLAALFDYIYYYGDDNIEGPVLVNNFTTSNNTGVPALLPNLSNINLESLNILYSKIDPLKNYISYILNVDTLTSNSVTTTTTFVYDIKSPIITECQYITYTPTYNAASTRMAHNYGASYLASRSNYTVYNSSNTFANIKLLHRAYELEKLSNCMPDPFNILIEYINNNNPQLIFNNFIPNSTNNTSRFDIQFGIPYYYFNTSNFTYIIILNNISYKQIYKYDNINYEGTIYYNDDININYILDSYQLSNNPIYINLSNTNYKTLSNSLEIRIGLSDDTINNLSNCVRRNNHLINGIIENATSVETINLGTQNLSNYSAERNYTQNTNYQLFTITQGDINIQSIFNSNYIDINVAKSNCQINLTNTNILSKFNDTFQISSDDSLLLLNMSPDLSIFPEFAYGKQDSNDSLRYYYILRMRLIDGSIYYPLYSIKFYYGDNAISNIYKNKLYYASSNYICDNKYIIQPISNINQVDLALYTRTNNYVNLLRYSASYIALLSNLQTCSNSLTPLSSAFMNNITGNLGFSPVPPNAPADYTPIYTRLLYYKNNLNQLSNNYVFSIHTSNNLTNPDIVEYNLDIIELTSNCGTVINKTFYRTLTLEQTIALSNNGYVQYMDGINIERNLSNCGINYNTILSNNNYGGPLSDVFPTILNNNTIVDFTALSLESATVYYKRYSKFLGTVRYDYLLNINNSFYIEYGIHFLYAPSSNCSPDKVIWAPYINPSNITNVLDYASSNNYISVLGVLSDSQKMQMYGLNAYNNALITTINDRLSNLSQTPTYSNSILSIQYVQTDYTHLSNSYIIAHWSSNLPVTLTELVNNIPDYLKYNITLSNIQTATNYTTVTSSIPTIYIDDMSEYTQYYNNIYYKNGTRYTTDFYEISFSPANCYPSYTASNLIQPMMDLGLQSVVSNLSSETMNGIVAYRNNNIAKSYDYIIEIIQGGTTFYYSEVFVTLAAMDNTDSCASYLDNNSFTPTYSRMIDYVNLSNYINSNSYTSNINFRTQVVSTPAAGSVSTPAAGSGPSSDAGEAPPDDGFADYNQTIRKPQEKYNYIMFECETSFRIQDFKLYGFNDSVLPTQVVQTNNNSIVIQNLRGYIIKGYSFITNNISPDYDPKSWILKGTFNGKSWKNLDIQNLGRQLPRGYQLPLIYFDGRTKVLPQPITKATEKPVIVTEYIPDKEIFAKYYKQKINPSIKPEFKKYMRDGNTYYCLFDAYDLNRNLVSKDLIIGFVLSSEKVKKAILYENDEGNYVPFDLSKQVMMNFWKKHIMLPLLFNTSF